MHFLFLILLFNLSDGNFVFKYWQEGAAVCVHLARGLSSDSNEFWLG